MKYPRSVAAALAETQSKFALAEALASEIPPHHGDPTHSDVSDALTEVRDEIIKAGGEPKAVETLAKYRLTARWVAGLVGEENGRRNRRPFAWVEGFSFSSHNQARQNGLTIAEFTKRPRHERELRANEGKASKDGDPVGIVDGWSPEQRKQAAERLAKVEPEAVVEAVIANPDLYDDAERRMPRVETPSAPERTRNIDDCYRDIEKAQHHMVIDMHEAIRFMEEAIQNGWRFGELEWAALAQTPGLTLQEQFTEFGKLVAMMEIDKARI
jgi:hypothetical protein